jgi:nucleoside-diphosphate-sugar epimerase
MKLLLLGGTAWLGHTVAETALRDGHVVTCLARGSAPVPTGARFVRADRDTDDALHGVGNESWDAVVDLAREPGQVRRAVRDLERGAAKYVYVSSCSAYASHATIGADESGELLPPLEGDEMASMAEYGEAKVACERTVIDVFGPQRAAIVRPGLIGGPGDPTGRTSYWVRRFAAPSNDERRVLAPDAPELPTAIIDVRDLAEFIVRLATGGATGAFNALGDAHPLPAHLEAARAAANSAAEVVTAPETWLDEHEVSQWMGPRSLPLWIAARDWYGMNARSSERARAAGLTLRPLADTLGDSLRYDLEHGIPNPHGAGLTDAEERELLSQLGQTLAKAQS